jgi:hypothetical protein
MNLNCRGEKDMDGMENLQKKQKLQEKIVSKIKGKLSKKMLIIIALVLVVVIALGTVFALSVSNNKPSKPEIITTANLKKIIEVSELSTYECIYNGIVTVNNAKKPEKVDYHVSYEAKVKAGINFEEVIIDVDNETKTIAVDIPQVAIHSVSVDFKSMDFIFENKKAETNSISADAYKKCEADVRDETKTNEAIYNLAEENAKNIIEALLKPFVNQLDAEYTITIS